MNDLQPPMIIEGISAAAGFADVTSLIHAAVQDRLAKALLLPLPCTCSHCHICVRYVPLYSTYSRQISR